MEELIPSVWVFRGAFKDPQNIYKTVETLIDSDIQYNWKWSQTSGSADQAGTLQNAYRTNQDFPISQHQDNPIIKELDTLIFSGITEYVAEYSSHYGVGILDDEGYTLLKYENGTHYKQHHDCGGNHRDRVVSILVYLNDDYEGGQLTFPFFDVTYTPMAGDIVLFPSNYTFAHIAEPVTKGTKYAIVSWMRYGNV